MTRKKISIIGTGAMGTVLGKLLLKSGHEVIAWNRTISKTKELEKNGATIAPQIEDAVGLGDTILISVSDYKVSEEILQPVSESALKSKTLIQLSTGTPKDAVDQSSWLTSMNANYLDGAIMVTPSQMGTPEALMLISGNEKIFKTQQELLNVLARNTLYVGEKPSLASAWDLAFLSYFFSALIGFTHAAHIAKVEGIDISSLGETIRTWTSAVGTIMKEVSEMISSGKFQDTESTVKTCFVSSELILKHAQQSKITSTYPQFAVDIFKKAMNSGLVSEDGAAIYKVL
jgi:3-hydroxyisobutyrate dehydrogenase-like beta-hydroxyacid dehydrogenase